MTGSSQASAIGAEGRIRGQAILRKYIRPAARRVGIQKRFGWHTFRHSYSTLLRSVGTEFKVMQELLRHSSLRLTLDNYTQAVTPAKHAAQAAVLSLVFASDTGGALFAGQETAVRYRERRLCGKTKRTQKGHRKRPVCVLDGFKGIALTTLE